MATDRLILHGRDKDHRTPVTGLSFPDTGLTCIAQYSYFVTANSTCGTSANGSCASVTTAACGGCTSPGAPSITGITDNDPCMQNGIKVNYTTGTGAIGHNLLKDGVVVVTGYSSGGLYNPLDTASIAMW